MFLIGMELLKGSYQQQANLFQLTDYGQLKVVCQIQVLQSNCILRQGLMTSLMAYLVSFIKDSFTIDSFWFPSFFIPVFTTPGFFFFIMNEIVVNIYYDMINPRNQ